MNMMNTLLKLTDFGPRPIGSPANQAAADFIREELRAAGLEIEEQSYPCMAWEVDKVNLQLGDEQLEAEANAFSLACDVTAPLICAGTITELESVSMHGAILLLYGDLTRTPLSPKSWFLKDERDERVIQTLERLRPAAVIAPPTSTDYYGQLTEDWELDLPAVTVPNAVARKLIHSADSPVHLKISARRIPARARNILARKAGREAGRVVICAHFDTKVYTPGASDNAAGMAVVLELAKRLAQRDTRFGLEFIAFGSEEYLPIGDEEYLRRAEAYFPEVRCAINLDGVGPALGTTSITALTMPETIETNLRKMTARFPGVVWIEPWYESNHSSFAMRGVPAVALSAVGTRSLAHQRYDVAEEISPAKLEECANLVEAVLSELEQAG
jgi:aminopeptidase YwaD